MLALVREVNTIELRAASSGTLLARLEAPRPAKVDALRFSSDGARLFALQWDEKVQAWHLDRVRDELRKLKMDGESPRVADTMSERTQARLLRGSLVAFSAEELAGKIPPRDATAPPQLVDLSAHFNAPLTETWHTEAGAASQGWSNDLAGVPRGIQNWRG